MRVSGLGTIVCLLPCGCASQEFHLFPDATFNHTPRILFEGGRLAGGGPLMLKPTPHVL